VTADIVTLRIDCRNELGESPTWCEDSQTLYWVDVVRPGRVFQWRAAEDRVDFWEIEDLVTGLNLVKEGGVLVHGARRLWHLHPATGKTTLLAMLPPAPSPMRFNDGRCDSVGRLWVGTMPNNIGENNEALDILEHNGAICAFSGTSLTTFEAGLGCPNAICWSPDGERFYIADSCDGWIYCYRFDAASGSLSNRRPFCHFEGLGIPDGACVDGDGYLWNARWGAGAVARIAPDGSLDRVVRLPVSQPTSCCFGDRDRRTLYITSARFGLSAEQLRIEPHAGGVFSIRLEVPGIDVPKYCSFPTGQ
jgi:sugar lactone lactonase YvrE